MRAKLYWRSGNSSRPRHQSAGSVGFALLKEPKLRPGIRRRHEGSLQGALWKPLYASDRPVSSSISKLSPRVYAGKHRLGAPGISLLVDLTAEFPEHPLVRAGREYLAMPMLDAGIASEAAFRKLVQRIASCNGPVYIHCAQGHGRTGTVAAAVLIEKGLAATPQAAIEMLQRVRPKLSLAKNQRKFVGQICGPKQ